MRSRQQSGALIITHGYAGSGKSTLARELVEDGAGCVVFGCGGDRDRAKRPVMGEIATRLADLTIVTDDNPRSEEPADIRAAIIRGIPLDRRNWREARIDRREAIVEGIMALKGADDLLLIAGKGHETYQEFEDTVVPFDDRVHAQEALEEMGWTETQLAKAA